MKNKTVRFAVITAICLLVWLVTNFIHFKNQDVADFVRGFSMGIGIVTAIAFIYNLVVLSKQNKAQHNS